MLDAESYGDAGMVNMDAERRKELQADVERYASVALTDLQPQELRALLARDEALERVEALPDKWRQSASILMEQQPGDEHICGIAKSQSDDADELEAALGRDQGDNDGR